MKEFDEKSEKTDNDAKTGTDGNDAINDADLTNTEESIKTESGAEKTDDPKDGGEEPAKPFSDALDWVSSIVYAVVIILVINLFCLRMITVSGDSMNDTLVDNDRVVLTNFFYTPDYGDIVVIQADKLLRRDINMYGEPIIKRVIALEGDTVRIDYTKGEVYRNGELLEEDYIRELTHLYQYGYMESGKDYVVPENCVFVMGDNRNVSNDSRNLTDVGFIDKGLIMGRAFVRVSPIKEFKWL